MFQENKEEFQTALQQLKSLKEDDQLRGAVTVRRHLSDSSRPPTQQYIEAGAVPLLVSVLDKHHK
mgnify:CR=1 FL=1